MKKILSLIFIGLLAHQANAADWIQVHDGSEFTIYVNYKNIERHKFSLDKTPYLTTWVHFVYKQAQINSSRQEYWSDKSFFYFDCSRKKYDLDYIIQHDKQGKTAWSGKTKTVYTKSSLDWERAVPDTPGEDILNTVCAYAN